MAKTQVSVEITGKDKASPALKSVGTSLKGLQQHAKAAGMAMVAFGAIVVGVASKSVLAYAKMGDEVAKMAKRTGFSTEALSELRYAAELSGAALAGIEKASRTLSGAILDASFGLETYVRAFAKIGLSYKQLKPLSPEDQFLAVLEALAGLSDETERAALAADLFGRAGTQLLPMLADGSEGLKEMRQGAHSLGLVFDQEASVAAEKLTDAMSNVKLSITGAGLAIADALIPAITPLLDKVTEVIKKIAGFAKENETLTQVITGAGGLLIGLGAVLLILPKLKLAVVALGTALKALLLNPIVLLAAALVALGAVTYSLIKQDIASNKIKEAAIKVTEEQAKAEGKLTEELLLAQQALNELILAHGKLTPERREEIEESQKLIELWKDGTYVLNELTGALEIHTEKAASRWKVIGAGADVYFDTLEEAQEEANRRQEEMNKSLVLELELREELTASQRKTAAGAYLAYTRMLRTPGMTAFQVEQMQEFRKILGISSGRTAEFAAIQGFGEGGVVPGPMGQPVPAIVHGGETVLSPDDKVIPLENNINLTVLLDGEVVGRILNRYSGEAYLTRSHMRG